VPGGTKLSLAERPEREFGTAAGKVWIADDFDAPLPDDLLELLEGR